MGMEVMATGLALGSVLGAGYNAKMQEKQYKEQKRQYEEQKASAAATQQAEINKQKQLASTYKNMKTNLYTGDINGIATENLINNNNNLIQ